MGATLDALHRLQRFEMELLALRKKVEAKRRAVRGSENRLKQIDATIAAKEAQLKRDQAEADRVELDRKTREAEIARLREALNRTKTNKEYSAILTQLNTDKADAAKLEEHVLAMFGVVDEGKAAIGALNESRVKEAKRTETFVAEATRFEASVRDEIEAVDAKRRAAAAELPPSALRVFERVSEKHDGEAMAQALQVDPRREAFVCDGCHMSLTLEQINALRGRDEIQICGTCGRILFLDEPVASMKPLN